MTFNLNALLLTIHLLAAACWFGAGWYDRLMVAPIIKASGRSGVEHIRQHVLRGGGGRWFAPASMLTILSGAALYWRVGVDPLSRSGMLVTVGALLGIAALVLGITVHRPSENRLRTAVEGDDQALILARAHELERHTTFSAVLVTLAFLLMSLRYMIV